MEVTRRDVRIFCRLVRDLGVECGDEGNITGP
jgi:hypothetical protein